MFIKAFAVLLTGLALGASSSTKIDPSLLHSFRSSRESTSNVIVIMNQGTEQVHRHVNSVRFATRAAKTTEMKSQLEELSKSSQQNLISLLERRSFSSKSFWINNRALVKDASEELIHEIASLPEVSFVRAEHKFELSESPAEAPPSGNNFQELEWNLAKIEVEAAWTMPGGNTGEGVVIGSISTGVHYTHESIRENYRSEYGWATPYGGDIEFPFDVDGPGTRSIGLIAGSNGIGVAPGSQWIACQGCVSILCMEAALLTCGEWMACPTLWNFTEPDCSQAPNIATMSNIRLGQNDYFEAVVEAWHTAGIIPVFPIGDEGNECNSNGSPGGYHNVIGVGSTNVSDTISEFSSLGPPMGGASVFKPEVVAPGEWVRSAGIENDTELVYTSGTGHAADHVVGLVALLLGTDPALTFLQVKNLLQNNTDQELGVIGRACAGIPSSEFPNHVYGYGRINARKTLEALINSM